MHCFYHSEKEAVGICNSCAKGICIECAADIGDGIACRSRCEERARALKKHTDQVLQLNAAAPTVRIVRHPEMRIPAQTDYLTSQFSIHVRKTRQFGLTLSIFNLIIGLVLTGVGITQDSLLLCILGSCFVVFGAILTSQSKRSSAKPSLPETVTK